MRPALAPHIAIIAAHDAHIELQTGLLLATILGAERGTGLSIYQSLSGATQRRAVLDAAAKHRLTAKEYARFTELAKELGTARKRRNDVIHAVWAVEETIGEALIRSDPNEHIVQYAKTGKHPMSSVGFKLWIWKERDFTSVADDASTVTTNLMRFTDQVEAAYSPPASAVAAKE